MILKNDAAPAASIGTGRGRRIIRNIVQNRVMYLLILPALIYVIIFNYIPMYGVQIAFKDFKASLGIMGSKFVGLKYFLKFFNSPSFGAIMSNTIFLSLYMLIVSFPLPVLLAIMLNQCQSVKFKRLVQNVVYIPHFISIVVLVGMINIMFSPSSGVINTIIKAFGGKEIFFMGESGMFKHLYVWSGVWQTTGFNSIIYIAALSSVSYELHEAAMIDGATKFQRVLHIDIPSILPTVMVMLILAIGRLMNIGFEKVFLMQNTINIPVSEIVSTYVYKKGLLDINYSLGAAVGLFNNVINLFLLVSANALSHRLTNNSLW